MGVPRPAQAMQLASRAIAISINPRELKGEATQTYQGLHDMAMKALACTHCQ